MARKVSETDQPTNTTDPVVMYRDAFVEAAKVGKAPQDVIIRKQIAGSFEKAALAEGDTPVAGDNSRRFCISTSAVDRDNDTVAVAGWKTDNYLKNPVVLYAHDYSSLPIGKCTDLSVIGGKLMAKAEFADHPMAKTVLSLIDGGFLNATSVGFKPIDYTLNQERQGMDFKSQELLEFSVVPVPANPQALIAAGAAGIDMTAMKSWAEGILKQLADEAPVDEKVKAEEVKADGPADDVAETIGYSAIAQMFTTLRGQLQQATDVVTALIAGQTGNPDGTDNLDGDDAVETARLSVICSLCQQMSGSIWAVQDLTYQLRDAGRADDAAITIQLDGEGVDKSIKSGRVLSSANEARLKQAREHLDCVLRQLMPDDADTGDATKVATPSGESADCPECHVPMNTPAGAGCLHPEMHEVQTPKAVTDDVLAGIDDGDDVLAGLDGDMVREAFREMLSDAVSQMVKTETQGALDRARGRVQ